MVTRAYPRPGLKGGSGAAVWWDRYVRCCLTRGQWDSATQAAFGRYLAAKGYIPSLDIGTPRYIAWKRASGIDPGYYNRRHRRHLVALGLKVKP